MWAMGIAYCNRHPAQDGIIPCEQIDRLTTKSGRPAAQLVSKLCAARLFEEVDGGYRVHDYHALNSTPEEVERLREGARIRKQEERARKRLVVTDMSQRDTAVESEPVTPMSQRDSDVSRESHNVTSRARALRSDPIRSDQLTARDDDDQLALVTPRGQPSSQTSSSSSAAARAARMLGPKYWAAIELLQDWNLRFGTHLSLDAISASSVRLIGGALEQRGVDDWKRTFAKVQANDYLCARGDHSHRTAVSLFKVFEIVDKIESNFYDQRASDAVPVEPYAPKLRESGW
jgi:hypothetical protein